MNSRRFALAAFFLMAVAAATFCQTAKAPALSLPQTESTLPKARLALSKAPGNESFKTYLKAYALALPVHDAVSLCKEYLPKAPGDQRAELSSFAGSIALVSGRYADAAEFFAQSPIADAETRLKAVRCYIASGNLVAARKQLEAIPDASAGISHAERKNLALSWLFLVEGETEKAFILLQSILATSGDAQVRREALFLEWLIARSPDFSSFGVSGKVSEAGSVEALLSAEFPKSLESALVRKLISQQPSPWLLAGLYPPAGTMGTDHSMAQDASRQNQGMEKSLSQARLQVGWFSKKENAEALTAKLKKQGFSVQTEAQDSKGGEKRWAVIVDVTGDWSKTQARLKDMGYESYLLP